MKKLLALTISGLIGFSASAQVAVQQPDLQLDKAGSSVPATRTSAASLIYGSGNAGGLNGRPAKTVDASEVYGAGKQNRNGEAVFKLKKGHYIIGTDQSESVEPYSLFVNESANNPDNYVALYIENNVFTAEVGYAQIMMGAPTNSGQEIQFSPAHIDSVSGHLVDTAFESTKAKVLRISKKLNAGERGVEYGYMVRRLNVSDSYPTLMGMRAAESNLDLRVGATRNDFQLENSKNKIVVAGTTLIESRPRAAQETYEMFNSNGDFGAFYALTKSEENTRTTESGSETTISKFAIFMSEAHVRTPSANDILLLATPTTSDSFHVELYAPAQQLSWFQKIFGRKGRLDPKNTKWQNPFRNTFHSDTTVN